MKIFVLLLVCAILVNSEDYSWNNVEDKIKYYLSSGGMSGGVLRVANGTHNIYEKSFGSFSHTILPYSVPPITNETIFDLASLTKVTATLSCIMHLYDSGKISVDDLVTKYIPEYGNHGKENTTIKNLLLHNAGLLPDYPPPLPNTKKEVMHWIYNCSLDYPIGKKFPYKIDHSVTRKSLIRGVVHDPTAYLFEGVAGHAGLFSIAEDLETYMQIHLNKGVHRNGTRIYKEKTVTTFYQRVDDLPYNNRRALGWDTVPIQTNPPCGTLFSLNSFGHTGYTGTMMWADRDKKLIVILLTHRVHPTSLNTLIIEARSQIVDEVVRTLKLA